MYSVTYEDNLLEDNYEFINSISKFFTATTRTDLANFKTDAVYLGGMNPWDSCETSLYPLAIAYSKLISMSIMMFGFLLA